jgi:hypothetical protein
LLAEEFNRNEQLFEGIYFYPKDLQTRDVSNNGKQWYSSSSVQIRMWNATMFTIFYQGAANGTY